MTHPDIIFVVLDTQRADRLGCYGHHKNTSPHLDQFAQSAALFEQAIAPAQWTIPSHASMFTGLYPTAHQVTQSNQSLGDEMPHLVELLRNAGYETAGFCNNPLVGILNNGFKRGFETFYNYGGAIPSRPHTSVRLPWPLKRMTEVYTQFLRRISYPIQNVFAQSELALSLSLYAWLTPLWAKWANFKGQNELSIGDVVTFLDRREKQKRERPLFLFLNLMETHLPFYPPKQFVDQQAPYMQADREARRTMRRWNREAYRWAAPLTDGLSALERRVLSDMYDAEVAYQDHYLHRLFEVLEQRVRRNDTLTIIVGDHGDGLGEHKYFGHAFVAYQELVHVPLILHWPDQIGPGRRIEQPVSTRRVFHTALAAAGVSEVSTLAQGEIRALSLTEVIDGRDVENGTAYAEVYPPLNFVRAIEHRQPALIEQFHCLELRRAIVKDHIKLIQRDDEPDELFNLAEDGLELENVIETRTADKHRLNQQLNRMVGSVEAQRDSLLAGDPLDLKEDEQLLQRLRGLGYID